MELPVPLERFPSLIKTQEFLHPLLAKVFAEDRGARARARERALAWSAGDYLPGCTPAVWWVHRVVRDGIDYVLLHGAESPGEDFAIFLVIS